MKRNYNRRDFGEFEMYNKILDDKTVDWIGVGIVAMIVIATLIAIGEAFDVPDKLLLWIST